ncbi:MAG: WG repeat-containing protein [Janthinobacterium lividum]
MRYCYLLLVLLSGLGCPAAAQPATPRSEALFPFVEHGRWGFIDSAGAIAIKPRFTQVQGFSEGLAPVREGESYGYIDATGQFVIPPTYDFASPFRQGLAVAYRGNAPQLIDHNGHLVSLPATYKSLQWQPGLDRGGVWVATLSSYKRQLLDTRGHLLSPFFFNRIEAPSNNRLIVESTEQPRNAKGLLAFRPIGVLNSRGQFVIPYYRFRWISTFREGLAAALYQSSDDGRPEQQCIIDTTGRILAHLPPGQRFDQDERSRFSDGTVTVRVTTRGTYPNDEAYPTAIDRTGRPLFRNPGFNHLSAFYHGRAWVQEDDKWYLINKQGERLIKAPIEELLRPESADEAPFFTGGVEPVALTDSVYAALDSLGRIVRRVAIAIPYTEYPQRQGNIMPF